MHRIESDLTSKDKTESTACASLPTVGPLRFESPTLRLQRVHAMAFAVDLWVRHRSIYSASDGSPLSGPARRAFAGGLIVGLGKLFVLDDQETELVAYVYSLMGGAERDALRLAAGLLTAGQEPAMRRGFLQGLEDAAELVSQLDPSKSAD